MTGYLSATAVGWWSVLGWWFRCVGNLRDVRGASGSTYVEEFSQTWSSFLCGRGIGLLVYGWIPTDVMWVEHRHVGICVVVAIRFSGGSACAREIGSAYVGSTILIWCLGL